jgi:ubiquinone/menaquinone biosynthesis C-methylase UbiE
MQKEVFDRIARFYEIEHENMKEDIPFYIEYAKEVKGSVLELGCGTGRITIPVAKEGIKITGLDISNEMLNVARKKIEMLDDEVKKNIELVQGEMQNFEIKQKFRLIFIAFRSFQSLLTKKEQGECLQCVYKHLDKNGTFILDLFAPRHDYLAKEKISRKLEKIYDKEKDIYIARRAETTFNLANQTLKENWFYEWTDKDGQFHRKIWSFELSYLFRYEAELLLEKYGFKVKNVYGDFNKSPYNYYSGEQIFIATKS